MASTNKTPKLGLNQWAAGDEVIRTDFNADNAKIDAAALWVKLKEVVTPAAANPVNLNLVDLGLSQYRSIRIYFSISISPPSLSCDSIILRTNQNSQGKYKEEKFNDIRTGLNCPPCCVDYPTSGYIELWSLGDATAIYRCLVSTIGGNPEMDSSLGVSMVCNFDNLNTLNFYLFRPENLIKAGTTFTIYGIRK